MIIDRILASIKSRRVFGALAMYAVGAWVVVQVASEFFPALNIPESAIKYVWAGMLLGFPIACLLSWRFDFTAQGIKRAGAEPDARLAMRRIDYTYIALLLGLVVAITWILSHKIIATIEPENAALVAAPRESVAVLPFVDVSGGQENAYFAEGLSEELLHRLSGISELRVAARTSAFSFRNKNVDVVTVAQQLKVAHVLEGSIRKTGDHIRVATRLIAADTGYPVWSETYERKTENIFVLQDEIASSVASALSVKILHLPGDDKHPDTEAYAEYLRGRHFMQQHSPEGFRFAEVAFTKAIEISPDYAAAWDGLGYNYVRQADFALREPADGYTKGRDALQRALHLNPQLASAYSHLAWLEQQERWAFSTADHLLQQALSLSPNDAAILAQAATLSMIVGRLDEAREILERLVVLDPINLSRHHNLATNYLNSGMYDQAAVMYQRALALQPNYISGHFQLGLVYLLQGDFDKALASFELERDEGWHLEGRALAYHLRGSKEASDTATRELIEKFSADMAFQIAQVQAYRGDTQQAFAWLDKAYEQRDAGLASIKTDPLFHTIRKDDRWPVFLSRVGLAE